MKYYAKANTASPETGFISTGEMLTDAQAAALGEEKLRELVKRGVLGVTEERAAQADTGPEEPRQEQKPEQEAPDTEADPADEEDDLPELGITEDLVNDDADEAAADEPAGDAKKGGRRKAK